MKTKIHSQYGFFGSRALLSLLLCAAAKHLKRFVSAIAILAAFILGLMCLAPQSGTLVEPNRDRPGMDYRNFDLSEARPELCQTACESDPRCKAYTYVKPGLQGPKARCWLKSGVPNAVANECCISGVKNVTIAQPPPSAPFDLVWDAVDPNGIPLNPKWAWRLTHPDLPDPVQRCDAFRSVPGSGRVSLGNPPCTTQPLTFDSAPLSFWAGIGCAFGAPSDSYKGHVNWQPVTYHLMPIFWGHHSNSIYDDDDYSLGMGVPPDLGTLVPANGQTLELEFSSDETIDHFDNSPWWRSFHEAVDDSDSTASGRIAGDDAIIIGLLGIDTEHSFHTEIHPVFAIAIHEGVRGSPSVDTWAIFARNWGNEGFCSHVSHTLDRTTITFRLPWRDEATAVSIGPDTAFYWRRAEHNTWSFDPRPAERAVYVTFNLSDPSQQDRVHGELHLNWRGGSSDPCASLRARLASLENELRQLTNAPGTKAEIEGVREAAERRIQEWHRAHDEEVAQLNQQLAACTGRAEHKPLTAVAVRRPGPKATEKSDYAALLSKPPWNMTSAQRKVFEQEYGKLLRAKASSVSADNIVGRQAAVPIPPQASTQPPRASTVPDPIKEHDERQRQEVLCRAIGKAVGNDVRTPCR